MKITSKGQVTIPIVIREKLGLLSPDGEVEFIEERGRVYLRKVTGKTSSKKSGVNALRGAATVKMTTAQILSLTRR